ncbi:polysaccharide biosynthesis/export family protein [Psychroserpens mesophilus]|uniref:polysaccharide biosynthesis/export family protein n=1 Tax=Psychroserpens mesophilus TaxID=325473 RepID=UPI003D65EB21
MKLKCLALLLILIATSCATKKEILYLQDANENNQREINFQYTTIQPNDILKIDVETLVPEAAKPYNKSGAGKIQQSSLELIQLEGYLVSNEGVINFPILGNINVAGLTVNQAEEALKNQLISGGHLVDPSVNIRIVNAKVTILGEVNAPGTYNFTEQNITLLQALGYAGDLTINGKREDIIMTRDIGGVKVITHIDLTNTEFMNSEFFYIKPNDTIIVNPNNPRVKSAGYIGNIGTLLGVTSILLSSIILITR